VALRQEATLRVKTVSLHSSAMGKGPASSLRTAPPGEGRAVSRDEIDVTDVAVGDEATERSDLDTGRRRFIWASSIAIALTAVPFVWILVSDWGPPTLFRQTYFENNFFDLQARAIFHGHLSLPNGVLGIEGFVDHGRTYTYFGLFPSIIRMPILLLTSSLDGKLTPSSMLLAWMFTGLFASLLLWRVRILLRGDCAMGRSEATAYGILMATIMGGTIWMLLASIPYVFNEDISWSICLTLASLFALVGVVERPSYGRVLAAGLFILCANFDRATTGWACVVGACLVAVWFLLGFGGQENRRWFLPVLATGVIPLVLSSALNYAKFGVPFGVPITDQVWSHVNAYRERFLVANHNSEVGTEFVPTNVVTYLRPDNLSFSRVFPFVTLPTSPPKALGGVLFDKLYRTAGVPASTPLLCLLSIWGVVTAFRPRAVGRVARTRLLLLAAASAGAALMLWGYIGPRYLGDFVPFLVLASAVGLADIFRRLEGRRRRRLRIGAVSAIAVLALFSIAANIGMAIVPNEEWTTTQTLNYVGAQNAISDLTGHPLQGRVERGASLPPWAPAGQIYVVGDCSGLYISNGEDYSTVPSQQYTRTTWQTAELGQPFEHTFQLTVRVPRTRARESVPLLSAGRYAATAIAVPVSAKLVYMTFSISGGTKTVYAGSFLVNTGTTHTVFVTTDPVKHLMSVEMDGVIRISATFRDDHVDVAPLPSHSQAPPGTLLIDPVPTPRPTLCLSLIH
jgi:hypothetical protein